MEFWTETATQELLTQKIQRNMFTIPITKANDFLLLLNGFLPKRSIFYSSFIISEIMHASCKNNQTIKMLIVKFKAFKHPTTHSK